MCVQYTGECSGYLEYIGEHLVHRVGWGDMSALGHMVTMLGDIVSALGDIIITSVTILYTVIHVGIS